MGGWMDWVIDWGVLMIGKNKKPDGGLEPPTIRLRA